MDTATTRKNCHFGNRYLNKFPVKAFLFLIVWGSSYLISIAQDSSFHGSFNLLGAYSSEDNLPFWFYANTGTNLGNESHFMTLGELNYTYPISDNATLTARGSFFYRDNVQNEAQRKELFVSFSNNWLHAITGAFNTSSQGLELSASQKNFWMSANSRPMPGILLEAPKPLKLSQTFSLDWGIGHFFQNDEGRFVEDVWVHYKRLGVWMRFSENHSLRAQLQHFVQWAGTSPVYGDLRDDFSAFLDVFIARKAVETGAEDEFLNAVGNHMGSYLLDYYWNSPYGVFNAYHEHPFEDGSGSRLANFPDGIWGVSFQKEHPGWWSKVVYEFITTADQSGFTTDSGFDSYFRNSVYRSGWTYEGNLIGLPLVLNDPSVTVTENNTSLISNRIQAHHFGALGNIGKFQWTLKSTLTRHEAIFQEGYPNVFRTWYQYLDVQYPTEKYGVFRLYGGTNVQNAFSDMYGAGVGYQYRF